MIDDDDDMQFRKLRSAWLRYEKLTSLDRPRTAEENAQLYDAALYLAEFYGPRQYHGPMAEWPDADPT